MFEFGHSLQAHLVVPGFSSNHGLLPALIELILLWLPRVTQ